MGPPTRRRLLAALGGGAAVALAGCSDGDDPPPGLHAVTAIVLHRRADDRYRYPEDVAVRAGVENTDVDRHEGTLVVELRRASGDDSWERRREIDLPGGTTRNYLFVFADVADADDEFEASAWIEGSDGRTRTE